MISPKTELIFHFFRHGQSEANVKNEFIGGDEDSAITQVGVRQAKVLGQRLKEENLVFEQIYYSPLQRVVLTTKTVCGVAGYNFDKAIVVPALRERNQGVLVGVRSEEIYKGDNGRFITYQGPWFKPPGGESQKMVQRRVSAWLEEEILQNESFLKSERTLNFAIFGSGINFKCLFMDIMGFDASLLWKIRVDNCSISRFRFNHKGWFIDCVNDTGHLLGVS